MPKKRQGSLCNSISKRMKLKRLNENEEERGARLMKMRIRAAASRSKETLEEREARLSDMRSRASSSREMETAEEREARLSDKRLKAAASRSNEWGRLLNAGFSYKNSINYLDDIGAMSVECRFCKALKWDGESDGMCCLSGKVKLPPLEYPPEPLQSLIFGKDRNSKLFLKDIRKYNSAFQMTSFGANEIRDHKFMPTFKVQGQIYHQIGSLLPAPNVEHKFLQLYFIEDHNVQVNARCQNFETIDRNIVSSLQKMLHTHNRYVREFKTAIEKSQSEEFKVVIKADRVPTESHKGCFNSPTTSEVAVVIVGQDFEKRDIILKSRESSLLRISETHRSYDCLQYPLLFCRGEDGYNLNVFQVDPSSGKQSHKRVSCMSYYAYRLQIRNCETNHLHHCRKLFHQYMVDMYVKVETERLLFIRLNQKKLRVENYIHLQDAMNKDGHADNVGQVFILPSSFTGGPRYMHERTQDAMTYVRNFGRPDLFITFTTNTKWKEISDALCDGQRAQDRPDIVARVFHLKVKKLINLMTKGHIFGPHRCFTYSVEWQKRGLPHVHILLWLEVRIHSQNIDNIISAEFPNPDEDPELFDIVKSYMVHGPCGNINKHSPCMTNGKCTKKYPRKLLNNTQSDIDGYPLYRRRSVDDGGFAATITTKSGNIDIDNSWVVPYCPVLSRTFKAHINVELCQSIKSIKYVFKYINKGSDQATFSLKEKDEVGAYQSGRYVSSSEAVWRLLEFPIHQSYPPVTHLQVHLENGQRVCYSKEDVQSKVINPPKTTLLAFFELCARDDFAKNLYYHEVPHYYTFQKQKGFERRRIGKLVSGTNIRKSNALGRVYTVHPNNSECYYLRMLLHNVKGPTSYQFLRTVNGETHHTFSGACKALGLLEDDRQWYATLEEASLSNFPNSLRNLFAVMLVACSLSDPNGLWITIKESLSEDVLHALQISNPDIVIEYSDDIFNKTLCLLEDMVLNMGGRHLQDYGMPQPHRDVEVSSDRDYLREKSYDVDHLLHYIQQNEPRLTIDQNLVYVKIIESVSNDLGEVFFLDAPGGTGKTFLINLILAKVRSERKIALAVASSGIAATLLQGGRTAHSTFKLPLNLSRTETPVCNITKQSSAAKLLSECKLIVWDECTMANKLALEALNRTLQDIRNNNAIMGKLTVLLSGDFRQTLPVIPRGTRTDEISACIKSSFLWRNIRTIPLRKNMRVHLHGDQESEEFAKLLLDIGEGKLSDRNCQIEIPENLGKSVNSIEDLVKSVYPDLRNWREKTVSWWSERCILAARNDAVKDINDYMLGHLDTESYTYSSIDSVVDADRAVEFPTEFINSLDLPGLPPHKLNLKIGAIVMLLRNLDAPRLCNGTRLRIMQLKPNVIEAEIITGCAIGEKIFLPRLPLIPSDSIYEFKRLQFPLRLSFAMTINKSQGQTLSVAGIDLRTPCFTHGQFYVACSRVSSSKSLFFLANGKTVNVVYDEVLPS